MGNNRNPSVVVAIRSILRFVQDLDDRFIPLLRELARFPIIDKDVVEALGALGVVQFYKFGGEAVWPYVPLFSSAFPSVLP